MQSAEVDAPEIDGHGTLSAGGIRLAEGADFELLASSGANASGQLLRVKAKDAEHAGDVHGSVVLLTDIPQGTSAMRFVEPFWASGATAVVLPEDDKTRALYAANGDKTRVSMRLQGDTRPRLTVVAANAAAMKTLAAANDGAMVTVGVHALPQTAPRETYNAIGYLEGSDPSSGTILLTAHLDHLGIRKPVNGDAIYNGANDDAAGTTAVLELAHALAAGPRLRRNVLFVCYGSEEAGELGSTYFGEHPPVPLKSLVANLEFEMIGAQDPKMPKGVLLLTGWDRSNLGPTLKAHGALLGPDPYPEEHFFERSDNYALALKGVVAHTAAGWGTVPTYHQPDDDLAHLDVPFMTAAIQSLVEPVRWLADSDFRPEWNPGGKPSR
jgi:aminopeptidase YwaD